MKVIILVLFAVLLPFTASAETEFYLQVQDFTLKVYDNGNQIIKESGPIFAIGYTGEYYIPKPLVLKPRIELFGGIVDFNVTEDGDSFSAKTGYLGVKGEVDLGWNFPITLSFPLESNDFSVEPFIGLGNRRWKTATCFYLEDWNIVYGRLGIRVIASESDNKANQFFSEIALKYSLSNKMTADLSDIGLGKVTFRPGKKTSFYIEGGVKLKKFKISLFYEGLRFLRSPDVYLDEEWVFYPEVKADIYGLNLGYSF